MMSIATRSRPVAVWLASALFSGAWAISAAAAPVASTSGLEGLVKSDHSPLSAARVYAYQVADLSLLRATTGGDGRFVFDALPVGVYKVIAHKQGFLPAVVLVTRAAQNATDYLEFELTSESDLVQSGGEADFWSVRRQIPGDVLRTIEIAETQLDEPELEETDARYETLVAAGRDTYGASEMQRVEGSLGYETRVGESKLDMTADFSRLEPSSNFSTAPTLRGGGETTTLAARLVTPKQSRVDMSTTSHSLRGSDLRSNDVTFDSRRLAWSKSIDEKTSSEVTLLYVDENNFNTQGAISPTEVPDGTTSLRLGTQVRREITDGFAFRTGLTYQNLLEERAARSSPEMPRVPRQKVDAFGVASWRLQPGILVEYGLYSTLRDGSVSMTPHGSILMDIGQNWQADAVLREQVTEHDPSTRDFSFAYYGGLEESTSDRHFYKLGFERKISDVESFRIGATHSEIADTLRLFFNEDFFEQVESLYLVRGDRLPELRMMLSQKWSSKILATINTQYGEGGGGILTTDGDESFENRVRYMVTSLDTQFQRTDTGLFLAFHHIEQSLDPIRSHSSFSSTGLNRLQVKVKQELGFLMDLGSDWAMLLNVELSRGATPFSTDIDPEKLRSEVAGGIAVKF